MSTRIHPKNVHGNSPKKVSTRSHPLKMSTKIHPFWKKMSTKSQKCLWKILLFNSKDRTFNKNAIKNKVMVSKKWIEENINHRNKWREYGACSYFFKWDYWFWITVPAAWVFRLPSLERQFLQLKANLFPNDQGCNSLLIRNIVASLTSWQE